MKSYKEFVLEAFKDTDYKEYYRSDHIDPNNDDDPDYEYNDYIRSREDHRDEHNRKRGVKKRRGMKEDIEKHVNMYAYAQGIHNTPGWIRNPIQINK